jgi:hypothetical protein
MEEHNSEDRNKEQLYNDDEEHEAITPEGPSDPDQILTRFKEQWYMHMPTLLPNMSLIYIHMPMPTPHNHHHPFLNFTSILENQ